MTERFRRCLRSFVVAGCVIAGLAVVPTATAMGQCKPLAYTDSPHISGSSASSHGWWRTGNCSPQYATVGAVLEEFWTSTNSWHNMDTDQGSEWPGGALADGCP